MQLPNSRPFYNEPFNICLELFGLDEDKYPFGTNLRSIIDLPLALNVLFGNRDYHEDLDGHSLQLDRHEVIEGLPTWTSEDGIIVRAIRPIAVDLTGR